MLINFDSRASTGRTFIIRLVSSELQNMQSFYYQPKCAILRVAPISSVSYVVVGQTLHSLLQLPISSALNDIPVAQLAHDITALQGVHYLIIDEKFIVGLEQLSHVDKHLCQVYPEKRDYPFSGINIVLCREFS